VGILSDFQKGQIDAARLAKTATFISCTHKSSFQGYDGIHKSWEDIG
jgi:hypothetical protein